MKLTKPIKFSRFILPACLPEPDFAEKVNTETNHHYITKKGFYCNSRTTRYLMSSICIPQYLGFDATARRYGQRFWSLRRGPTAIHHPSAPHSPLRESGGLHGIHPAAHLPAHVLCWLWWHRQGCLPRRQRWPACHALPRYLLCYWDCELGRGLRTQGQIRSLHPSVQVYSLDSDWHGEAHVQGREPKKEQKTSTHHWKALLVKIMTAEQILAALCAF